MLVTLLGITTEVKPEQPEKAEAPMLVTLFGIMVDWQPKTNSLLDVFTIALHPSRESYMGLSGATTSEVKPEHQEKAQFPMLVALLGISTEVKPLQK